VVPIARLSFSPLVLFSVLLLVADVGAANPARLRGRAIDPDGRPVAGATVLVTRGAAVLARAVTDERGEFRIVNLQKTGPVEVTAAHDDGLRAAALTVSLDADAEREVTLALEVSAIAESVVVSAAQVDVPLSRAADSVTVVDARALEARQIHTIANALRLVPGIAVNGSGGAGGITSLFPRGGESNFTLVLVDGVPVNAFGGGFDFAHLAAAGVERVEIVRGAQSALFGGGAIGAVVSVVSRRGERRLVEGSVEGGSRGTWRADAGVSAATGAWRWSGSAERLESEGFTGIAPATGERVSNDDYTRHTATAGAGWSGPGGAAVDARLRVHGSERGFPGPFGSNPAGIFTAVDRVSRGTNDETLFGVNGRVPAGRWRHRLQASLADLDGRFVSMFDPSNPSTSESGRISWRAQTDVDIVSDLGVSAGAELQRERGASSFIKGHASREIPIERRVEGYFGEARYARGRLAATAGLRVEHLRRDALEGDPNAFSPRPDFPADTDWSLNPRVSALWFLRAPASGGWTKLRAAAGTGIRAPDAFEIAFTDNPALEPERSRSVEAGVEHAIASGAAVVSAVTFFNEYDDLIVAVGRSLRDASRFRTDNIANARARGVELAASWRARGLALTGSYTWLDAEILAVDRLPGRAPSPFGVGDRLLRRPRHQAAIDVILTRGRLSAFALATARGAVLDVEPSFGASAGLFEAPGFVDVSAGASIRVARSVEAYGRVVNLFDRTYEEAFGFPAPRRSGFAGVRVALGR
jgi:outer membrane cobalamin receptor